MSHPSTIKAVLIREKFKWFKYGSRWGLIVNLIPFMFSEMVVISGWDVIWGLGNGLLEKKKSPSLRSISV